MCSLIFNAIVNRVHYIGTYGAFVGGRLKCMTQVWQDTGI